MLCPRSACRKKEPGNPAGALDWLALEDNALYWAARFQRERYGGLPVLIAENGKASPIGWRGTEAFTILNASTSSMRYLAELQRARWEGLPFSGHFYWSLVDNF